MPSKYDYKKPSPTSTNTSNPTTSNKPRMGFNKPKMGFGKPKINIDSKPTATPSPKKEPPVRPSINNTNTKDKYSPKYPSSSKTGTRSGDISARKYDPRPSSYKTPPYSSQKSSRVSTRRSNSKSSSFKKPVVAHSRPTNVNTESSNEYRKIQIIWDKSFLTKTLRTLGQSKKQADIESLIVKVDGAIKKYIKVRKDIDTKIELPPGFSHCRNNETNLFDSSNFTKNLKTEGDLFIFLYAVSEKNQTLAAAAPCLKNKNSRTVIGRLLVNIDNLKFEYGNYHEQFSEVNVIFHEVLHIMAFHSYVHSGLKDEIFQRTFPTKFKYLRELKHIKDDPLLGEAHWNEAYLPNDLMIPVDRIDSKLTIFSLEYLDLISDEIKTERKSLPNNFLLDEITDLRDFFTYTCSKHLESSKYSFFCTEKQFHRGGSECERSRLYKAACGSSVLNNGCTSKQALKDYLCTNRNVDSSKVNRFEYYGENSRCFDGLSSSGSPQSLCLKFEINSKGVLISSGKSQYQCTQEGQKITMEMDDGEYIYSTDVICPNPREFKRIYNLTNCPYSCYGNGHCSDGQCLCFDGYDESTNCRTKSALTKNGATFTSAI